MRPRQPLLLLPTLPHPPLPNSLAADALENGAKSVVLMSHLGRPDGNANPKFTMKPCVAVLEVSQAGCAPVGVLLLL